MKSSVLIVALLVAVSGFAQTTTPGPALFALVLPMVYDANGVAVGQLIDVDDANGRGAMIFQVANPNTAVTVHMRRDPDGVRWGNTIEIYYPAADCQGDGYVFATLSFGDFVAVVDQNEDLLLADTQNAGDAVTSQSVLRTTGKCENASGRGGPLVKLTRVDSMKNYFKTPLVVRGLHRTRAASK